MAGLCPPACSGGGTVRVGCGKCPSRRLGGRCVTPSGSVHLPCRSAAPGQFRGVVRRLRRDPEGEAWLCPLTVLPPQVPWDRSSEVEELRSIIENLRENQQRLQREKAEETERLHEVIERLQRELSLGGPAGPGAESGRPPAVPTVGPEALAGATGQLLVEQERRHGQALEALQQRLRAAEEAAATQLADLERCAARGEAQVRGLAAQVQAFEAALEAKEARIAERDSEIDAMKRQKLAQSAELETLLAAFSRFRLALEQQPLAAETEGEPPELRRLRARCVRLGRQLQLLHLRFLSCQGQPDGQQAPRVHLHPRVEGRPQGQGPRAAGASWDEESPLPTDLQGQAGDTQVSCAPSCPCAGGLLSVWGARGTRARGGRGGTWVQGCAGHAGARGGGHGFGGWGVRAHTQSQQALGACERP